MSDSIRDTTTAQNNDVAHALHGRQKLLEQLYATTVSFVGLKLPKFHHDGVGQFLTANDITKGRSFNSSTLPGANLPQYLESKANNLSRDSNTALQLNGDSRLANGVQRPVIEGTHYAESNPQDTIKPPADAGGLSGVESVTEGVGELEEQQAAPHEAVQVEGGNVKTSAEGNGGTREHSSDTSRPLFNDAGLGISNGNTSYNDSDGLQRTSLNSSIDLSSHGSGQVKDRYNPSESKADALQGLAKVNNREAESQKEVREMRTSQEESPFKAPSSLDEQTQLEDPRSMHDSVYRKGQSSPGLPSQFLHGSLVDGESLHSVSNLQNEQSSHALAADQMVNENVKASGSTLGLRTGMNGEASKDLTFSRRPPMRIDTAMPPILGSAIPQPQNKATLTAGGTSQATASAKSTPIHSSAQSPPERMTTRVSSGALRHKSVSEILGETPRSHQAHAERGNADAHQEEAAPQTPKSASSIVSPDPAIFRQRLNEINQKEKSSKLSTVVFAKPHPASNTRNSDVVETADAIVEETPIKDRNYLMTWFVTQAYTPSPTHQVERKPLNTLLRQAHKTLRTSDIYVDFDERQYCRILAKVQELQVKGRWSLRQPVRCAEPSRSATHWDVLLGQVKWMRTDFREERKWKAAGAKFLAEICAQWVVSSPQERKSLQLRVRNPIQNIHASPQSTAAPTPDLVHSGEDEDTEAMDEDLPEPTHGEAPAAIFSLPPDMFVFGLNRSPVSEKILHELPLYLPNAEAENGVLGSGEASPDASWKVPLVPISKYTQGKIISCEDGPPRKRSRYSYSDNDAPYSASANERLGQAPQELEPEKCDIALFNPENKHIRDRIHTGHAFRPPSEHIMPPQSFFECRQSSQWTMAEDDELRRLVREYAYNWSLISSCLTPRSSFSSGAERRTPWECFERWVSLEGLPAEMSKVNYFRAYHTRLQQAQRVYEAQQQQLIQQHPNNAAQPPRRRSTQPFTVERRKNNKHIHLIDAMRKLAKKRETKMVKDQHLSTAASLRKNNEPQKPRQTMHTPREFSRIKYESQVKREEQLRAARLQYIQQQQQRASMVQRATAGQQPIQQPNAAQLPRNLAAGPQNGSSPNARPIGQLRGSSGTAVPQIQRPMNGQANGTVPTNAHGVPHAPMQPHLPMQMGQRIPTQVGQNMLYAATQVQAEQQAQLQRQRHLQHSQIAGQVGSPNMQSLNPLAPGNLNMMGPMDGRSSPAVNGAQQHPLATSASPNMTQPQALSSGLTPAVNQIQSQIKLRNPQASPEQIRSATTEQLYRMSQQHAAHQAMQSATGNANANAAAANSNVSGLGPANSMQQQAMMGNPANPMLNAAQYAQLMIDQQRKQQGQRSGSIGNANQGVNGGSRGATPLNQPNGGGQGGGGRGLSQSPRQGQVGVVGAQ